MAARPDPFGPQRRIADVLSHAARVIQDAPWELGPSQRVTVDFAPNANVAEVAVHRCDPALLDYARSLHGDRAKVKRDHDDPNLPVRWVEFEHDGLTVVFYRR